jgi:hypothetical protein
MTLRGHVMAGRSGSWRFMVGLSVLWCALVCRGVSMCVSRWSNWVDHGQRRSMVVQGCRMRVRCTGYNLRCPMVPRCRHSGVIPAPLMYEMQRQAFALNFTMGPFRVGCIAEQRYVTLRLFEMNSLSLRLRVVQPSADWNNGWASTSGRCFTI